MSFVATAAPDAGDHDQSDEEPAPSEYVDIIDKFHGSGTTSAGLWAGNCCLLRVKASSRLAGPGYSPTGAPGMGSALAMTFGYQICTLIRVQIGRLRRQRLLPVNPSSERAQHA